MRHAGAALRPIVTLFGLLLVWWCATRLFAVPSFMLPDPWGVAQALVSQRTILFWSTLTTLSEIVLGLLLGTVLGAGLALLLVFSQRLQRWLMPLLLISQAIPVFALAPLLVLWFGFGMSSKVVMAVLVIFFPITAAFYDGLRRTDIGWLELARTMDASPWAILRHVRLMAALPAFGAGLRVAAAVAPIGAIIGEWVGASAGLGYVMMNANARIQTNVMFAALFVLSVVAIILWVIVDRLLKRLLYWAPDTAAPR
ncbi:MULTISPECIES: ABC transporter permease [unclassified Acidisoma]|jgi:putative hydroxymethylpyrimidine transport system permease protein|uniref:ABC transporter permease n=1 Tax=unclassified Acidisoma TaxID=2634065 RepID=UPI00131C22BF|nr:MULTISPECIES: ABC transporter permease [unclassified Acidisoma]